MPKKFSSAILFCVFSSSLALADVRIHCDGAEENLAIYQNMHKTLFMERDYERTGEFYAEEFISHNRDGGRAGARKVSVDFMKDMWRRSKENDPGRKLDDELILCIDDFVVVRTTMSGNNYETIAGSPPQFKPYEFTATDIYRFENGKVVERWGNADVLTRMRQLGFELMRVED